MEAKDRPSYVAPVVRPPPMADGAEVEALKVIVMAMVATRGFELEQSGVMTGRMFVNRLSEVCQEALIAARFDSETLRQRAIGHVNGILGGVGFPPDSDETN
jgi:hypothetical protein